MAQLFFKKNEKKPWEDIPLEIIIEEKRKKKEIEDSWRRQPRVYDYDIVPYMPLKKEEKKEPERGVVIIKMY